MFKNWKVICQMTDAYFMRALIMLDVATDFGRMIVERLPEFFTIERVPIPLSVMLLIAEENAIKAGLEGLKGRNGIVEYGGVPSWIPLTHLALSEDDDYRIGCSAFPPDMEERIREDLFHCELRVGNKYFLGKSELIFLGICFSIYGKSFAFCPAECVVVDK